MSHSFQTSSTGEQNKRPDEVLRFSGSKVDSKIHTLLFLKRGNKEKIWETIEQRNRIFKSIWIAENQTLPEKSVVELTRHSRKKGVVYYETEVDGKITEKRLRYSAKKESVKENQKAQPSGGKGKEKVKSKEAPPSPPLTHWKVEELSLRQFKQVQITTAVTDFLSAAIDLLATPFLYLYQLISGQKDPTDFANMLAPVMHDRPGSIDHNAVLAQLKFVSNLLADEDPHDYGKEISQITSGNKTIPVPSSELKYADKLGLKSKEFQTQTLYLDGESRPCQEVKDEKGNSCFRIWIEGFKREENRRYDSRLPTGETIEEDKWKKTEGVHLTFFKDDPLLEKDAFKYQDKELVKQKISQVNPETGQVEQKEEWVRNRVLRTKTWLHDTWDWKINKYRGRVSLEFYNEWITLPQSHPIFQSAYHRKIDSKPAKTEPDKLLSGTQQLAQLFETAYDLGSQMYEAHNSASSMGKLEVIEKISTRISALGDQGQPQHFLLPIGQGEGNHYIPHFLLFSLSHGKCTLKDICFSSKSLTSEDIEAVTTYDVTKTVNSPGTLNQFITSLYTSQPLQLKNDSEKQKNRGAEIPDQSWETLLEHYGVKVHSTQPVIREVNRDPVTAIYQIIQEIEIQQSPLFGAFENRHQEIAESKAHFYRIYVNHLVSYYEKYESKLLPQQRVHALEGILWYAEQLRQLLNDEVGIGIARAISDHLIQFVESKLDELKRTEALEKNDLDNLSQKMTLFSAKLAERFVDSLQLVENTKKVEASQVGLRIWQKIETVGKALKKTVPESKPDELQKKKPSDPKRDPSQKALQSIHKLLNQQGLNAYLATDYSVFDSLLMGMLSDPDFEHAWTNHFNLLVDKAHDNLNGLAKSFAEALVKNRLREKLNGIKAEASQIHADYRQAISAVPATTTTTSTTAPTALPKDELKLEESTKAERAETLKQLNQLIRSARKKLNVDPLAAKTMLLGILRVIPAPNAPHTATFWDLLEHDEITNWSTGIDELASLMFEATLKSGTFPLRPYEVFEFNVVLPLVQRYLLIRKEPFVTKQVQQRLKGYKDKTALVNELEQIERYLDGNEAPYAAKHLQKHLEEGRKHTTLVQELEQIEFYLKNKEASFITEHVKKQLEKYKFHKDLIEELGKIQQLLKSVKTPFFAQHIQQRLEVHKKRMIQVKELEQIDLYLQDPKVAFFSKDVQKKLEGYDKSNQALVRELVEKRDEFVGKVVEATIIKYGNHYQPEHNSALVKELEQIQVYLKDKVPNITEHVQQRLAAYKHHKAMIRELEQKREAFIEMRKEEIRKKVTERLKKEWDKEDKEDLKLAVSYHGRQAAYVAEMAAYGAKLAATPAHKQWKLCRPVEPVDCRDERNKRSDWQKREDRNAQLAREVPYAQKCDSYLTQLKNIDLKALLDAWNRLGYRHKRIQAVFGCFAKMIGIPLEELAYEKGIYDFMEELPEEELFLMSNDSSVLIGASPEFEARFKACENAFRFLKRQNLNIDKKLLTHLWIGYEELGNGTKVPSGKPKLSVDYVIDAVGSLMGTSKFYQALLTCVETQLAGFYDPSSEGHRLVCPEMRHIRKLDEMRKVLRAPERHLGTHSDGVMGAFENFLAGGNAHSVEYFKNFFSKMSSIHLVGKISTVGPMSKGTMTLSTDPSKAGSYSVVGHENFENQYLERAKFIGQKPVRMAQEKIVGDNERQKLNEAKRAPLYNSTLDPAEELMLRITNLESTHKKGSLSYLIVDECFQYMYHERKKLLIPSVQDTIYAQFFQEGLIQEALLNNPGFFVNLRANLDELCSELQEQTEDNLLVLLFLREVSERIRHHAFSLREELEKKYGMDWAEKISKALPEYDEKNVVGLFLQYITSKKQKGFATYALAYYLRYIPKENDFDGWRNLLNAYYILQKSPHEVGHSGWQAELHYLVQEILLPKVELLLQKSEFRSELLAQLTGKDPQLKLNWNREQDYRYRLENSQEIVNIRTGEGFTIQVKKGERCKLPSSVRQDPNFRFLFKELDPTVTSEEGKNDVVDYNMYDESGKHTFTFRHDKKKNAVQIFQIVDQGKFLFQKLSLSQSKRYQFWHFFAGKANYFIEDTIENRGVWIPLTQSEHVDASKVLIAQYGMDLSKDPITLWISEDRITGATIGEGEDKKWICAGLSSTDKQLLSFRTERGLLLLSKNGSEVDEIRFPVDNGSKEQLVLKKKGAGLWVKSGREHWEWQLTNTKKYESEFGKNWREYILPLKNRETGEEEIWIFPYMITQSEDGNQIKFLKAGGDFIDLLGGPISKVADQLLKNEDLSQHVDGTHSGVRAALPAATVDDLKGLYLAIEYWMGGPSRVFEGISVFNRIVGSKHAKLDNALQQVQDWLSEIPVPTAIRYVKEKRTSKSSHAGFFYLAHAAAQRQDWGAASYYLQLMMDNGDYSSPEDVDQLRRMALMLLSAQAIGQIDLSNLTDMADMKDGVSTVFAALKKIIAPKCPLECAFRIKLTAALLTLNQQLLAQQKIQFLDTQQELFIRAGGAVLHAHYIQTLPHHYRKLKENGMLVKKEEEQLLLSRPEMMLLGAAAGMVRSKESKAFLKNNKIPKELIDALNDDVKKRPPLPNLEVPIPDPLAVKEMFEVMTLFINQSASPALLPLPDLDDALRIVKHAPAFVNQRVIQGIHQKHGHYPKWQTILSHFWHYYHWIAHTTLKAEDIAFLWREIPRDPKLTDFQHRAIETARATLLLFWFYRQTSTYQTFRKANHLLPYATDQIDRDAKRLIPNIGEQQQKGHLLREEAAKEASAFGAINAALHTAYLLASHFMNEWEYDESEEVAGVEEERGPTYDFVKDSLAHFDHYLNNSEVQNHYNRRWVMTPEGIRASAPPKPIPKVETPETKALNLLKQANMQHMHWFKNGFEDEAFETLLLSTDFEKEWQLFERKTEAAWQEKQKVASQTPLPVQTGSNRAMENAIQEIGQLLDKQRLNAYLATDYSVFNDTLTQMLNSPNFGSAWTSYYDTLVDTACSNLKSSYKSKSYESLAKTSLQQKLSGLKDQAAQIHATYRRAISSTTTTTTVGAPKSPQVKELPKKAAGLDKFKAAAATIYTDYQKSLTPSEELQRTKNRVWNSFMGRLLGGVTQLTELVENMNKGVTFAEKAVKGFKAFFGANVPEESDPSKLEEILKALKEVPRLVNEKASTIKPAFNYLITLPNFEEHFEFFEKEILSVVAKMINQKGVPLWVINWIKDYIKTAILETCKEYRETVNLPQSPYPPHIGKGQYREIVRVKPADTAYHWEMHFNDARRRYNALKGEWEIGESIWDQRMVQALKDFEPRKAKTEQAKYKFQKICNGIVQGNKNMHTKTGSSLEVADLEKIDQKIAEAIGSLRPQQQKLYEEVLDFGKIHADKLGISHLFADRIRITDEQILQKILDLYRYGQFDRMNDRKLQRQFAELITEFILIATEIHQYEKAVKSCKELKGVLKKIWKEIPLVFGESERIMKAQTAANQSPVWILHSAELKRVLSEGSNRHRYTTSVTKAGKTVHHLRDQKFTRRYLVSDYRNRWISRDITIKALEDLLRDLREGKENEEPVRFIRAKMGSGKSDVVFPEAIDMMIQEGLDPIMIGTAELVPDLKISLGHKVSIFEFAIDFDLTDDSTDKDIITQLIYIHKELEAIESEMPDLKKEILQQSAEMQYRHLIEKKKIHLERVLWDRDFAFEEQLTNMPKEYLKANNPNGSDLTVKSSQKEIQAHLDYLKQELELMDSEKKLKQQKNRNKKFLTEKKQKLEYLLAEMRKNGTHTIPEEVRKDFPREYLKTSHRETVIHLTALAEMLENLKIEQKAVLTSPEHIAAVRNKRVYLQSLLDSMPAGQERSDLFEQLQLVKRIEAHFKKGTYLIDEDVNFTVNFEHNLATGDYRATDITRFNCAEKLVRTIHKDHKELWDMMVQNNLRKIRDVKVEFRDVAKSIVHDHEFWQRVGKEEWNFEDWSRIDEKEFIDYLLGIQENLPNGMARWEEGEESHLKAHVAALKTFLSTTLDSVRGVNPNLERAVSSVNGVVVIPLDTDGQEKKGVLYAEESENILHHIFHYLGTGNKIGEEIFYQKYREKGASKNRISHGYPERWLDWASDIAKYAFQYHSEYDAFINAPELALHRFQLLRYLMLETPYIRVYHKQINFNLQHLGIGTDIRVASGTGEPFALNLEDYMSTDKTKDEDVVLGETLLCLDLTLETKPFSNTPLEHIIECAKNPECLGILNYDYEVAGSDSETLAAILRKRAPGRQIIYKNREGKKQIWNSGPQFSPMAYEPSAIDPERAFFIYLRKDSRGVHFDIPIGKGKYADAMIGTANKEDAIQQLLWRARQLGTGQTARLSCDEKTAAQIRKANGLSPTAPITQGHAMRYFTLNTLEEESITNVKAVTRKAQKPLEKHLDATIRSGYNLTKINKTDALEELESIIHRVTEDLYFMNNIISWMREYQPSNKIDQLLYVDNLYAREIRKAEGMGHKFSKDMRELVKKHPDAAILNHCDQGVFERVDLLSWIDGQIEEIFKEKATKKEREKRITELYEDVDRKIARVYADHHAPRLLGIAKEMAHKYLGIKIGVKRALTKIWEARFRLCEPRYLLNFVDQHKEEATKRSLSHQAAKANKALESVGKSILSGFSNLFGGTNRPAATNKPVEVVPQLPPQEVPFANRYFEIKAEIKASGKEFAAPDLARNKKYREFLVNHLPAKLVEDPNEGAGQQQKAFQMQFQKQKENVKNVQRAMHLSDRRNRTEPLDFDAFMQISRGKRTVNSFAETWNKNGNCMALKDVLNMPFWIVSDAYPNCYISHRAMELLRAMGVNGYPIVRLLVIQHGGQYHSVIVTKPEIEETIAPALKKYRNGYLQQQQIALYGLSSEQTLFRSDGIWGHLPDETTRAFTHLMMMNKLMLDWDKFLLEEFDHLIDWVKNLTDQELSGWVYHFNQIGSPNSANLIETIWKPQGGNRSKSPEWLRNHVLRKLHSNCSKAQYSKEQLDALEEYVVDELRGTFFDNEIHALSNKNYENSIELLQSIKSKLNRKKNPSKDPLGNGKMKEKKSYYFDKPI